MPPRHNLIQVYIANKAIHGKYYKQLQSYKDAQMQYDKCHQSSILYNDILAASKASHITHKAISTLFYLFIYFPFLILFIHLFYYYYFFLNKKSLLLQPQPQARR